MNQVAEASMHITPVTWLLTFIVIIALLAFDYFFHVRKAHVPTIKEAAVWSALYIGIAIIFGIFVTFFWKDADPNQPYRYGVEWFSGYVTEKALSVDNLFVFLIIMASFAVPPKDEQKALMWGIVLALIFRFIFIIIGAAALNQFAWLFYIFAIFLGYTAAKQIIDHRQERKEKIAGTYQDPDMSDNIVVKAARKFLPITDHYAGDKILVKERGRKMLTPLFLVIISLGAVDLMFALDSIPAIFGLTEEAYIVFTTNAFSLMGLRQLYFLIEGLLDRLIFLAYGLAAILGFIAVKLWLHAMHVVGNPFSQVGGFKVPEIGTTESLLFILVVLTITVVASLWYEKTHPNDPVILASAEKQRKRHAN